MLEPMRVYELAKRCGVDSRTVMTILAESDGGAPGSASSKLEAAQVDLVLNRLSARTASMPGPEPTPAPHPTRAGEGLLPTSPSGSETPAARAAAPGTRSELKELLAAAFDAARASGKEDWRHMSTAVLKNRLSQAIEHPFDERSYDYRRILELAQDFPELVTVDTTKQPPVLFLLPKEAPASDLDESVAIRPDLWKAVIDYVSEEPYYLCRGRALPKSALSDEPDDPRPLPTITEDEFQSWREEFAAAVVPGLLPENKTMAVDRVEIWLNERRGTAALPGMLRGHWNLFVKTAVHKRLINWFSDTPDGAPKDLTVQRRRDVHDAKGSPREQLRSAIVHAVQAMSYEELRQVQIPATALLRRRE